MRIGREVAGVLALKLVALVVLYEVFFAHAPVMTPGGIASHLLGH